jgi:hypothetical protein
MTPVKGRSEKHRLEVIWIYNLFVGNADSGLITAITNDERSESIIRFGKLETKLKEATSLHLKVLSRHHWKGYKGREI